MLQFWHSWKYKNLTFLLLSILLTVFLSRFDFLSQTLFNLAHIPIIGSLIAGILYVSTSTVVLAILIILDLTKTISPIEISIVGGVGAVVGDIVFFRFFRKNLLREVTPIYDRFGGQHITKLLNHKFIRWSLPIIGIIIIASPLPDEVGASLIGLTKINTYQFAILSLILNMLGIFLLINLYSIFKM